MLLNLLIYEQIVFEWKICKDHIQSADSLGLCCLAPVDSHILIVHLQLCKTCTISSCKLTVFVSATIWFIDSPCRYFCITSDLFDSCFESLIFVYGGWRSTSLKKGFEKPVNVVNYEVNKVSKTVNFISYW